MCANVPAVIMCSSVYSPDSCKLKLCVVYPCSWILLALPHLLILTAVYLGSCLECVQCPLLNCFQPVNSYGIYSGELSMCVYMFLYALSTASFVAPHSCSVLPVCVCVPQCPLFDCFHRLILMADTAASSKRVCSCMFLASEGK